MTRTATQNTPHAAATVTTDAHEFGIHVHQGGWRLGMLVARNVVKSPGRVAAATLAPKTNATRFAKDSKTTVDRVLRYLDAWEAGAEAGHVPHATDLQPGMDVDLNVDRLPSWDVFYRQADRRREAQDRQAARERRMRAAAEVATADAEQAAAEVQALAEDDQAAAGWAENLRLAAHVDDPRVDTLADIITAEQQAIVEQAGAVERARASRVATGESTAPVSDAERRGVDADLDREVKDLILAVRSYTRRLFDVARDRSWVRSRDERAVEVLGLAEQLVLVAGIVADPEKGHVADASLDELLTGRHSPVGSGAKS